MFTKAQQEIIMFIGGLHDLNAVGLIEVLKGELPSIKGKALKFYCDNKSTWHSTPETINAVSIAVTRKFKFDFVAVDPTDH